MLEKNKAKKEKKIAEFLAKHSEQKLENTIGDISIFDTVEENCNYLKELLGSPNNLIIRRFKFPTTEIAVVFFDMLADKDLIYHFVMRPITDLVERQGTSFESENFYNLLNNVTLEVGEISQQTEMKPLVDAILYGDTALFVNGCTEAFVLGTKGWSHRGIGESRTEQVIRGSREGLTEGISVNSGMIRRRLRDPLMRVKTVTVGRRTKTPVEIIYIDDIVNHEVVSEVERRINKIDIDGILESGYIEEFIEDHPWSPFPQIQNTERPDNVVAHLLEGKVVVLVDGTPNALIMPSVFSQFYFSPEDYYERFHISSFIRIIRLIALSIALLLPAIYVAFASFHPEMLPSELAIAMAAGRSPVPFTPFMEVFLIELSVEILREASIRLPGPIGPTFGIVGGLVIGQAAVSAGLMSPAIVIVVGLTTISSYANPSYNAAISIRLLRFVFMILAASLGLYGIMLGLMMLMLHLVSLSSFGVPYMAPFAPLSTSDLKDSLIRVIWKKMQTRPTFTCPNDERRLKGEKT